MTNQNQNVETTSASVAAKSEVMPRLVLLFIALVIGAIVAFSFGHAVNVYGYRMEQSAIKLQGNPEQFEKTTDGKMRMDSFGDYVNYSVTDDPGDKGAKTAENTAPEFYYRFQFSKEQLDNNHLWTQTYRPTADGKCERILINDTPIEPKEPVPYTSSLTEKIDSKKPMCHYEFDFDDYFTWKITKPEEKKDWTNK
ncbi:hypothetical protein [uncultured Corynebacterium sp.]|uniref:hypothetical protein n=1 Tax=uncultured Corynebacterium sp. TaxID=159447 RepID=UPI00259AC140|nr:hypothetical protein [uncultured Corynebacterium sp.]